MYKSDGLRLMARRIGNGMYAEGLTQSELSEKSGVSRTSISHYLKGQAVPSEKTAAKIGKVLGMTPDYILGGVKA